MNLTVQVTGSLAMLMMMSCSQQSGSPAQESTAKDKAPEQYSGKLGEESEKLAFQIEIYRGKDVLPGAFLPVVGLTSGQNRLPICTGTVIDSDIVLTAAHCICDHATGNVFVGHNPNEFGTGGGYYEIVGVHSEMNCDERNLRTGLDLALVRVRGRITETRPVAMATASAIDSATHFRVVGFGASDLNGQQFEYRKQEADVPAVSNACNGRTARGTDADVFGCFPGSEIVAGRLSSPDTCNGDSGGPLLAATGRANSVGAPPGQLLLAGVTSRPTRGAATACGAGGLYERLTPAARGWIAEGIRQLRAR